METLEGLKLITKIQNIFKSINVNHFIFAGCLLGLIRDGKLIEHDNDIDFGIYDYKEEDKIKIQNILIENGFVLHRNFYYNDTLTEQTYLISNIKIDIFYFYESENESYCYSFLPHDFLRCNEMIVFKTTQPKIISTTNIKVNNYNVTIPSNYIDFITCTYGEDWKTHKSNWNYWETQNNKQVGIGYTESIEEIEDEKKLSFIIPYRNTSKERKQLFDFTYNRLKLLFKHSEIIVIDNNDEKFNRGKALNTGAKKAKNEILVLNDADIIYQKLAIHNALKFLSSDNWIIPFTKYIRILEDDTNKILNNYYDFSIYSIMPIKKCNIFTHTVGAISIISNENYIRCRGFDERLDGWGFDDNIFQKRADILVGKHIRIQNNIYHLHHKITRNAKIKNKNIFEEIDKINDREEMLIY